MFLMLFLIWHYSTAGQRTGSPKAITIIPPSLTRWRLSFKLYGLQSMVVLGNDSHGMRQTWPDKVFLNLAVFWATLTIWICERSMVSDIIQ